jgi:hypothetical protein
MIMKIIDLMNGNNMVLTLKMKKHKYYIFYHKIFLLVKVNLGKIFNKIPNRIKRSSLI